MIAALPLIGSVLGSAATSTVDPAQGNYVRAAGTDAVGDFGQVLNQVATGAVSDLKAGEAAAISGLQGKMPVQQVVQSVMSAQQSLQTALAVRDKVVSAYQEISRMTI